MQESKEWIRVIIQLKEWFAEAGIIERTKLYPPVKKLWSKSKMKMWLRKHNIGKSFGFEGITVWILTIWQESWDDKVVDWIMNKRL